MLIRFVTVEVAVTEVSRMHIDGNDLEEVQARQLVYDILYAND